MRDENPLLYRFQQTQKRRSPWSRTFAWALYPLLLLAPTALMQLRSSARAEHELPLMLTIFLSFAYLCVRTLFDAVGTLARERQRGTLESLATTGFPARLWVGTLFRLCIRPRLVEVAAWGWLPFVLLAFKLSDVYFLRRLEPISSHYLPFMIYSSSCIVFYASAGLWLSARARSLAWAQLQAIALLSATFFGALALDISLTDIIHHNGPLLSPLVSPWMVSLWEMLGDNRGGWSQKWDWVLASLAQAGLAWLFFRLCIAKVRAAGGGTTRKAEPGGMRLPPLRWVSNPLIYRNLQQLSQQRLMLLRFLAYPAIFFSLRGVAALLSVGKESYQALQVTESCLLLTLFGHALYLTVRAAYGGSLVVAEERESGSWESILSTRLSLNELLWGQWASAVLPTVGEGFLWSFLWLTYYGTGKNSQVVTLATLVPLISYSLIWTAFIGTYALWRSGRSASAAQALRHTTTLVLILSLGPVILSALFSRVETFGWLSPAYGLGELVFSGTIPWTCMALYGLATPVLLWMCRRNLKA